MKYILKHNARCFLFFGVHFGSGRWVGGTQIEAHLLNALARGWQHRRAVVVVVVLVFVLVVGVVVVVLPLISLYPAAQRSPPSHLEYPSSSFSLRAMRVCTCMRACVCAYGESKDNLWHNYYNVTMFRLSSSLSLSFSLSCRSRWQFFCSSPSSHLLLAVFGTFPCGLQREIRFSTHTRTRTHTDTAGKAPLWSFIMITCARVRWPLPFRLPWSAAAAI